MKEKSLLEFMEQVSTEEAATEFFERQRWGEQRTCPHCRSSDTIPVKNKKPQPYRCKSCKTFFSVKTGSIMHKSKIPLRKWALAIFLLTHSKKGVSSCKLGRDLGLTQKTAWAMAHKIRNSWQNNPPDALTGAQGVEVDETYVGGKERNKHGLKRLKKGRGPVGKTAIIGMKDRETNNVRAQAITALSDEWGSGMDAMTLRGFVLNNAPLGCDLYTDNNKSYRLMKGYNHDFVTHTRGNYVKGETHTNGVESLWAVFKRMYNGTYHSMSKKHLPKYVTELCERLNGRKLSTDERMGKVVRGMDRKRLPWKKLISCFIPGVYREPCFNQYVAMICYFCACCISSHVC